MGRRKQRLIVRWWRLFASLMTPAPPPRQRRSVPKKRPRNQAWASEQSLSGKRILEVLHEHGELTRDELGMLVPGVTTHGIHLANLTKRGLVVARKLPRTRGRLLYSVAPGSPQFDPAVESVVESGHQ
jgi:hypothetical protein